MPRTLFAHVTDTHIVEPGTDEVMYVDNNARVAEAVRSINAESPSVDAIIATGDLAQWGTDAEYATLTELFDGFDAPVWPLAGNHDDRDRLRRCFPDQPWVDAAHASWTTDVADVRVIGLDTTRPGEPGGEFDAEREQWLTSVLANAHDGPVILAMHHPPFRTGIAWMDDAGFIGLERLTSVIASSGNVDRIICGHIHRPITTTVGGVPTEVGLSTTVHVALSLDATGPIQLIRDPAGYRIFSVDGSDIAPQIVGHTRYIATGEVPFVPEWADPLPGD